MKVQTFPLVNRNEWAEQRDRELGVFWTNPRLALPFVVGSGLSTRIHRTRWVSLRFRGGEYESAAAHVWCGQLIHLGSRRYGRRCAPRGRLLAEPLDGWAVCGTCHGRAVGAGQVDEEGTPLLFSPRDGAWPYAGARCNWEALRGGWAYGGYGPCGGRARFVVERDGYHRLVCRQHEYSALRKGWAVVSTDPAVGRGESVDVGRLVPPPPPEPPSRSRPDLAFRPFEDEDSFDELLEAAPLPEPVVTVKPGALERIRRERRDQ